MPRPIYKSLTQLKAEIARLEKIREDAARKAATIEQQIREKSPRVRAAAAAAIGEAVVACVEAGQRQIDIAKLRPAAIELLPKRSQFDARLLVDSLLGDRLPETVDGDERDTSQDAVYRSGAVASDSVTPKPEAASPSVDEIPTPTDYAAKRAVGSSDVANFAEPPSDANSPLDVEESRYVGQQYSDVLSGPVPPSADASLGSPSKVGGHSETTTHAPRSAYRTLRPGSYRPQS